jgi:hypothetical protein
MEPWRVRFPTTGEGVSGGLWGIPVVVNTDLKPEQWILVDSEGSIIAAGNGVE